MRAYVALGSNLGDSQQQLLDAIEALAGLPDTRLLARSVFIARHLGECLINPTF